MEHIAILRLNLPNFGSRSAIFNIIFNINKLAQLWVKNFIPLGICFIFGTKFSWNEGIDTCFNVECVLLRCGYFFFWRLLGGYCSLPNDYCSLPGGYCLLLLIHKFTMNVFQHQIWILVNINHRYNIWCHLDTNENTFRPQTSHTQVLSRTLTPDSHLHFEIFWSYFKLSKHDRKQLKMGEKCRVYLDFFFTKVLEPLISFFKCLFRSHQFNGWI